MTKSSITYFKLIEDKDVVREYIEKKDYNINMDGIPDNTYIIANNNNHVGIVTINEIEDYKSKHVELKNLYIEYNTLYLLFVEFILKRNVKILCLFIKNRDSNIYKEIVKSNLISYFENNKIIVFNSDPKKSILVKSIVVDVSIGFITDEGRDGVSVKCELLIKKLNKNYYLFIKDKILSLDCDAYIKLMQIIFNDKTLYFCNYAKYSKIIDNNNFVFFINGIKLSEIQISKHFKNLYEIILCQDNVPDNKKELGYLYIIQRKDFIEENKNIYIK